jgi:hypothetical protein
MVLSNCKHLQTGRQFCQGALAPSKQPVSRPARLQAPQQQYLQPQRLAEAQICRAAAVEVQPEAAVPGMSAYLDTLRWSKDGLVPVIVQVTALCYSDVSDMAATTVQPTQFICVTINPAWTDA